MSEHFLITQIITLAVLFFVVLLSSMGLKRIGFPYTIGLVVVGVIIALLPESVTSLGGMTIDKIEISPAIILYILLPTLIFEASINIDTRLLMKNIMPVLLLAVPGVVISMAVTAWGLKAFTDLSLTTALIFGALISATDPVAVIALFKEIGAPKRLCLLVDGESLLNDATAIVLFNVVFAIVMSGATNGLSTILGGGVSFLFVFAGGFLVGAVIAALCSVVLKWGKGDGLIQITGTLVIAYVSFIVAQYVLELSGVMAAMAAGMYINWFGTLNLSHDVRQYVKDFWGYLSFLANSFIFLLVGISAVKFFYAEGITLHTAQYLLWGVLSVLVARAVIVYGGLPLLSAFFKDTKVSMPFQHIIFWGGLRGAVPLILAFSLANNVDDRIIITELTLTIVLFTLFVQGTTLRPLMNFFKLDAKTPLEQVNEIEVLLATKQGGLNRLGQLEQEGCFQQPFLEERAQRYLAEAATLRQALVQMHHQPNFTKETAKQLLWHHTLAVEKDTYVTLYDRGFINRAVRHELELNIELADDRLDHGVYPEEFVIHVPIEVKVKTVIAKALIRFAPQSKYILRLIQNAYIAKYEISLATIMACNHIELFVKELSRLYDFDANVVDTCLHFYRKRKQLALEYVNAIAEEDVPLSFRKEKIRLMVLSAEDETLHSLEKSTNVFDKVLIETKEHLSNSIEESKDLLKQKAYENL